MSSSAGLLTPRGPFSGAAPLALRPLSAIAASTAGGVPEARIKRLLSDLLPSLMALHAQGEICGDISLDTVGMDENARAHLVPELVVARSRRATRTPTPGFAPFELYTDSVEWPRGPWSDIYALCAVMHALVIGSKPAPAPERRAQDTYEPLASLGLAKYSEDFLSVIDAGLAMAPADRPQTLADLAGMLGIAAQVETAPDPVAPAPATRAAPAATAAAARQPARGRHPLLLLLLVVALIGAGVYAWFESGMGAPNALITRSEVVQPNPPAVHPLPPSPPAPGPAPVVPPSATEPGTPQEPTPQPPASGSGTSQGETRTPTAPPAEAPAAPQTPPAAAPAEVPAVPAEEAVKPKPVPVLVRLDIRPWGEVWVNGVARGISPPVKELRLIPGKYQVVLRNADLPPYRTTLEVKAGKPTVISHVFQ
ncbi:serine/threonine protein kinase [Achromobacter insolitus]|uniref:serine/threonine protein kinase n=1 Tax=Achromobacter TaxID=222 RepID=UPI000DD1523D|nr:MULTISPECIES: serine/threonine protein kinase [Achromobacter]AXA73743.1 serine/threonine protein kinase [Achromobacter insolitus]MEB3094720.1 serine/threonine protein kinase [Achromobacter sp. D10]